MQSFLLPHIFAGIALLATVAAATSSGEPSRQQPLAVQSPSSGCPAGSIVQGGSCVYCAGLARPFGNGCYDRFEVTAALASSEVHRDIRKALRGTANSALRKAMDKTREDNFNNADEESSNSSIGISMVFHFGGLDAPNRVEKLLVWKRQRDPCATVADDEYVFEGLSFNRLGHYSLVAGCLGADRGDHIEVTCAQHYITALTMRSRRKRPLSNCDVPAEVEAYGTTIATK